MPDGGCPLTFTRRGVLAGAGAALLARPGQAATAEAAPVGPMPLDLLFLGDSLAQGMFLTLNPVLRRRPTPRVINGTLHATGVTRSDEYDWTSVSRDLVARHHPHLVVFWIGANDFRPLVVREERARFGFGTAGYTEHYGRRVAEMVGNAAQAGARVAWLGLPNMRESQVAGAARQLNAIQRDAALNAGAVWIDTWQATSDAEGRYVPAIPIERAARTIRAEDGVHFTDWGYRRIGAILFEAATVHFPELATGLGRLGEA